MQNQHKINYQTSYFGNTVLYVVESVGSIADNGLPLAVSGGFGTKNCQTKIKVKWKTKN